jgi:hypothetical protein
MKGFFLVSLLAVLVGAGRLRAVEPATVAQASAQADVAEESKEMAQLRQAAKHRQRRIIYNNDGGDLYGRRIRSVEDFLDHWTEKVLGTQVDSIFYCTGVTTVYSHDTEIAERYDDLVDAIEDTSDGSTYFRNNMPILRKAGVDSLKATIRRAHEAGLEVFWSHRINDTHDSSPECERLLSQWKRKHPECLMGVPEDTKKYPSSSTKYWWSALDFEQPEVRDYLYRITEEVGRRYDVDGIEIDYWRYPVFFRPNMDGQPATSSQLDILTEFQRSIRQMAVREGAKRGRPILIAARVPMSVDACRNVGIDIKRWLKEDLLDVMSLGNGEAWPNIPAGAIMELGHEYDVPVYPCLKYSGYGINHLRTWRAAAANAWRAGADGVYFFNITPYNYRDPDELTPQFKELGDPAKLMALDKWFSATAPYAGQRYSGYCPMAEVLPSSMALPATLSSDGQPTVVILQIGDDIAAAAERNLVRVRLNPSTLDLLDAVETRLNGKLLTPTEKDGSGGWTFFSPNSSWYRVGDNEFDFRLLDGSEVGSDPVQVVAVDVLVRYND